ncbi:MAG TPA: hypothetical protein VK741_23620 [Acetobacteraceae bacterium]|nr:hypothetical protein [Acetobacteraceae bacterium]
MIRCTHVTSGLSITLPRHAFVGRFFPAAPFSATRTARRIRDAAFTLAHLDLEGAAPFVSPGGSEWVAEMVEG